MVKKLVTAMVLMLATGVVHANEKDLQICMLAKDEAKKAQIIRQTGVSLKEAIEIIDSKELAVYAYIFPQGRTIAEKGNIVEIFSQLAFDACMKYVEEKK